MSKLLDWLERLGKWVAREPLRVRLYSILVLFLGWKAARGELDAGDMEMWLALAALVLGVERSRAKVTPVEKEPVRID